MADGKCTYDDPSRLLTDGEQFRNCSIAFNACGYTPNKEYLASTPDTISDGDNKGRDPEDGNQQSEEIGTQIDIDMRNCLMAKNSDGYTKSDQYLPGHEDTLADGDCKGRDPEDGDQTSPSIGTNKDIEMRKTLMAKNSDGYTPSNQYGPGHNDTFGFDDERGRDPDDGDQTSDKIGTKSDNNNRHCSLAFNAALYTKGNEYCAGSDKV